MASSVIAPDSSSADEALLAAAVSGNLYGVRRALQAGAALDAKNAEGFTAVCIAAERGHSSVLEVLCDAGLDAGQQGSGGWTPLMWAARNGHLECVSALCRRAQPTGGGGGGGGSSGGIDLDAVNDNGSTALMVAATCGHAAIIAALADAGADLYVATAHNASTALHLAASCGNWAAAEQLVALDASKRLLGAATAHGATALHLAAHAASDAVIRALLDANADVHAKDRHRCTPLHYAMRAGDERCVALLLAAGAGAAAGSGAASATATHKALSSSDSTAAARSSGRTLSGMAGSAFDAAPASASMRSGEASDNAHHEEYSGYSNSTAGVAAQCSVSGAIAGGGTIRKQASPASRSSYDLPSPAGGVSTSSKLAAARRLVAARHRTHTTPSAVGGGGALPPPPPVVPRSPAPVLGSVSPHLASPTVHSPTPSCNRAPGDSVANGSSLQYSSVGGAASLDASVYGVSSGTGSGSDGAGIAAVERLRHELGEQKRALSRAFAHIDEMRERGEGVASEARQISSTPSAFAGGGSVTALLASAAAGAPVSVSDVASAAAAAATAATRKEQEALLARVSALEEQVRQQAATISEAEANSRRAAIATAALNAEASLRSSCSNVSNKSAEQGAGSPSSGAPSGVAATLQSLIERTAQAERQIEEMRQELQSTSANAERAAAAAASSSGSPIATTSPAVTSPAAIEGLRASLRAELRTSLHGDLRRDLFGELGSEVAAALRGDAEPQLRAQVADLVGNLARREIRDEVNATARVEARQEAQVAVQEALESAVQREVSSAAQQWLAGAALQGAVKAALTDMRVSAASEGLVSGGVKAVSAEIQLQQEQQLTQRRQALELSDLQRELRSQQLSVESLQRELSAIRARSSPTHPSSRQAASANTDEVGGTGSSPSPTDGKSPTSAVADTHSRAPLADSFASSRAAAALRHDLDALREALSHQIAVVSERQGEAERGSAELRLALPRVNLTLDGHTASIRHLEDELAAMSNAQRAVSVAVDEATTAAQVAQVTGDEAKRRAEEAGSLARETAVATAALLRGDEATSGAAGAAGENLAMMTASAAAAESSRLSAELEVLHATLREARGTLMDHSARLHSIELHEGAGSRGRSAVDRATLTASGAAVALSAGGSVVRPSPLRASDTQLKSNGSDSASGGGGNGAFASAELLTSEPWRGLPGASIPSTAAPTTGPPEGMWGAEGGAEVSGPAGVPTTAGTGTGCGSHTDGSAAASVSLSERPRLSRDAWLKEGEKRPDTGAMSPVASSEKGEGGRGPKWDIKKLAEEIEKSKGGDLTQWLEVMRDQVAIANEEERQLLHKQRDLFAQGVDSQASAGASTMTYQQQVRANKRLQRLIDEARSRVEEVRGLVRTALAHGFVTQLQTRISTRLRYKFALWAEFAGFERPEGEGNAVVVSEHAADRSSAASESGSGSGLIAASEGRHAARSGQTPSMELISRHAPALQRLGLSPMSTTGGGGGGSSMGALCSPPALATSTAPPAWARSGAFTVTPSDKRRRTTSLGGGAAPSPTPSSSSSDRVLGGSLSLGRASSAGRRRRSSTSSGHQPEEILAVRGSGGFTEYRIRWKGFSSSQSETWELGSQMKVLPGFAEALGRFEHASAGAGTGSSPRRGT